MQLLELLAICFWASVGTAWHNRTLCLALDNLICHASTCFSCSAMVVAKRWRNRCDSGTPDVGTVQLDISGHFAAESGAGACEILSKAQQNELMQPPDLALLDCWHFCLHFMLFSRTCQANTLRVPFQANACFSSSSPSTSATSSAFARERWTPLNLL